MGDTMQPLTELDERFSEPGATATEEELIAFCKDNLASYKNPRSVEFRDSLPKTGSGKIRKAEMRETYWQGHAKRVH